MKFRLPKVKIKTEFWDNPEKFINIIYVYQFANCLYLLADYTNEMLWWIFIIMSCFNALMMKSNTKYKKEKWPLKYSTNKEKEGTINEKTHI